MASAGEKDRAVFDEDDDVDDDDDEDTEEEEGDDNDEGFDDVTPNLNHNPNPNPNAFSPPIIPQNSAILPVPLQTLISPSSSERKIPVDESRRLFQRLWTDEDEIVILEGFLDFTTQRGTTHANYQHDTGPFYEQIKNRLQLDFNKNQLIEKLRRLKKKYRNVVNRMGSPGKDFAFKSSHEKATYEISRKIWSSTFKRPRNNRYNPQNRNLDTSMVVHNGVVDSDQKISTSQRRIRKRSYEEAQPTPLAVENPNLATQAHMPSLSSPIPNIIEETVKCCLSPLFKELLHYATGGPSGGSMLNSLPFDFGNGSKDLPKGLGDEKWKKQHILELEVYLKRVELLEEQIKSTLEELRSSTTMES